MIDHKIKNILQKEEQRQLNDTRNFIDTSGIRIGNAAMVTKKGTNREYFKEIALNIIKVIKE